MAKISKQEVDGDNNKKLTTIKQQIMPKLQSVLVTEKGGNTVGKMCYYFKTIQQQHLSEL